MVSQTGGTRPVDSQEIGRGRPPGVLVVMNVGTILRSAHKFAFLIKTVGDCSTLAAAAGEVGPFDFA